MAVLAARQRWWATDERRGSERRRERERATRTAMGKGTAWQPDECVLGKGRMDEQSRRATQVSGARSKGMRRGQRRGKEMAREPDKRAPEKGADGWTSALLWGRRINTKSGVWAREGRTDKHRRIGICYFFVRARPWGALPPGSAAAPPLTPARLLRSPSDPHFLAEPIRLVELSTMVLTSSPAAHLKVPSMVLANWWNLGLTFVSKWMI
jgi:hypothetical protein